MRYLLSFCLILMGSYLHSSAQDAANPTPDESLRAFLRLVTKGDPKAFGFDSVEEAGRSRLGHCYGVWRVESWHGYVVQNGGTGSTNPDLTEDKLYEVLGDDGRVKCVMAFALKDGWHQPWSLSVRSKDVLERLQTMPERDQLVLVIDEEGMKWADVRNPQVLHAFPDGIGANPSGPRGGFLPLQNPD